MNLNGVALLVIFSLVMSIDAASIPNNIKQLARSNTESTNHVLPPPPDASAVSRYLRTAQTNEGNERTPDSEERSIPNEILNAVDHAGKVYMNGIYSYDSSFLNWLDRLSLKLKYKYWLLKKKTPEAAARTLGLHYVTNIELHPHYEQWLGYVEAYKKKFHKKHLK